MCSNLWPRLRGLCQILSLRRLKHYFQRKKQLRYFERTNRYLDPDLTGALVPRDAYLGTDLATLLEIELQAHNGAWLTFGHETTWGALVRQVSEATREK